MAKRIRLDIDPGNAHLFELFSMAPCARPDCYHYSELKYLVDFEGPVNGPTTFWLGMDKTCSFCRYWVPRSMYLSGKKLYEMISHIARKYHYSIGDRWDRFKNLSEEKDKK